ncbi:hypothetical protein SEA_INTOLERANT_35 [Streptomyces phage Intolerant]|nr:hypothetical protein SEA_INTOLERANT_35 [Streptomyces phage Intolerant]
MAQGEWGAPGAGSMDTGRRLSIAMYRPPNNRVCSVLLVPTQENMTDEDWQALLDGLASVPGMAEAMLREGAVAERQMGPDRAYEALPPVDDN